MWRALHEYCSSTKILPLWIGFLITAVFLYSIKNQNKKTDTPTEDSVFTFKKAVAFGLMQSIAVLPGISRFASTYALGCWYGYKPSDALWFSFLIQLPLLIAANGLLILTAPLESLALSELSTWVLLASCVSAYGVLTLVAHKAYRCTFWHFSWYALGLAALAFYLGL
jgi:undecaprenyl-diphosphatase